MHPQNSHTARTRAPGRAASLLVAGLAVAAAAFPAAGAVRYVAPNGLDTNNGTSPSSPWSLSKANSSLVAGDVAILAAGNYGSTAIRPANNGSSGAYITYVGSLTNPTSTVTSGQINLSSRRFISVKGVQCGSMYIGASSGDSTTRAQDDSVSYCVATGGLTLGALRCHILRNRIGNDTVEDRFISGSVALNGEAKSSFCTIRNNVFNLRTDGTSSHCMRWDEIVGFQMTDNTFNCTVDASASDSHILKKFGCQYNLFRGNRYNCLNLASYGVYLVQRNCVRWNVFDRDTVIEDPRSVNDVAVRFSTAGNYPGCQGYNTYANCFYKTRFIEYQNDANGESFFGCTFACTGYAITFDAVQTYQDSMTMRHCTFFSSGNQAVQLFKNSNIKLRSNVFYASGSSCPIAILPVSGDIDSNLVFSPTGSSNQAVGGRTDCSAPAGASRWGDPMFTNATYANFNPMPRSGSAAVGSQWKDGYVGAVNPSGLPADVTPPAAVVDLGFGQISDRTVEIVWTAPGDDGMSGSAAQYDLRWSTSPITAANFASATPVSPPPVVLAAGSGQSYLLSGLTPNTRYYVALRTMDEAGNWSTISNLPNALTSATDTISPAAITDLSVSP
jgi:hypothetical protein